MKKVKFNLRLCLFVLLLCFLIPNGNCSVCPIMKVDGIGMVQDPITQVCRFFPTCGVAECAAGELEMYLFEWEFSPTDYSLEANPERVFTNSSVTAILRATGIKQEDDPDGDGVCDGTGTIVEASPGERTHRTFSKVFQVTVGTPSFGVTPAASFGAFGRPPIPADSFTVPLVFQNPSSCTLSVVGTFSANIKANATVVACYRPAGSGIVTCSSSKAGLKYTFQLLPNSKVIVLARAFVPAGMMGERLNLRLVTSTASNPSCQAYLNSTITTSLIIEGTIDPQNKDLLNGPTFMPGQEVRFGVKFMNSGIGSETDVAMRDTLDKRFDWANLQIEQVWVDGFHDVPEAASEQERFIATSYFFKQTGRAFEVSLHLVGADQLKKGERGLIVFSVPLRTDTTYTSEGLCEQCPTDFGRGLSCSQISNNAFTFFSKEVGGIWHKSSVRPKVCVVVEDGKASISVGNGGHCCCCCWGWIVAGILGVIAIILFVMLRRARRGR